MLAIVTAALPLVLIVGLLIAFLALARRPHLKRRLECEVCGTPPQVPRIPADFREMMLGGWTCSHCLTTVNRLGKPIPGITGRPASNKQPLKPWQALILKYAHAFAALGWGLFMWLLMTVVPVLVGWFKGEGLDLVKFAMGFLIWGVVGAGLFGGFTWILRRMTAKRRPKDPSDHF